MLFIILKWLVFSEKRMEVDNPDLQDRIRPKWTILISESLSFQSFFYEPPVLWRLKMHDLNNSKMH